MGKISLCEVGGTLLVPHMAFIPTMINYSTHESIGTGIASDGLADVSRIFNGVHLDFNGSSRDGVNMKC